MKHRTLVPPIIVDRGHMCLPADFGTNLVPREFLYGGREL